MVDFKRTQIKEALVSAAHRLDDLGLVPARAGNLSARVSEDTVLVTRTQVCKRHLCLEDFVEVGLDGIEKGEGRASTELGLHLAVYRARSDVAAIVHAHPPTACAFAVAGRGLIEPLMPEAVILLGSVPLTPYATPGTQSLEEAILPVVRGHDAFLLANHGAVTTGQSVDQAVDRMEILEHVAKVTAVAELLGGPKAISQEHLQALLPMRRNHS